jgi:hypothetical protein
MESISRLQLMKRNLLEMNEQQEELYKQALRNGLLDEALKLKELASCQEIEDLA